MRDSKSQVCRRRQHHLWTRTVGKAPTLTGEQKDWPERSFQITAFMGSANPKSIEALRWAAMEEDKITAAAVVKQSFEDHNPQLCLALTLLCEGSALVTVQNTMDLKRGED